MNIIKKKNITHFEFIKSKTIKTKLTTVKEKWVLFSTWMTRALMNCWFEIIISINTVDEFIILNTITKSLKKKGQSKYCLHW